MVALEIGGIFKETADVNVVEKDGYGEVAADEGDTVAVVATRAAADDPDQHTAYYVRFAIPHQPKKSDVS